MKNKKQIILHIDMNSYFASVEQQANPHLRGKPIGVCEHLGGIIIAPSVEAKRFGIKLGTTTWDALKIYPKLVLLSTDPDKYRAVTLKFMKILEEYTDDVELYSIDEAFLNITKYCNNNWNEALMLGLEIKQRLRREVGEWVSCSIGIGPNRLVSKIAADLGEGDIDRICVIHPNNVESLYDKLKLIDVPGIGTRLQLSLAKLNINSLKELRDYPLANLINQYGINGYLLHKLSCFDDVSEVTKGETSNKSIGHAYTVPKPIGKIRDIKALMYKLSEKVARRLRRQGARANTVHYFHGTSSFGHRSERSRKMFYRQKKSREELIDGKGIFRVAYQIFNESGFEREIKTMGISVSGLIGFSQTEPLFDEYKKLSWLNTALDKLNDRYGEFTVSQAVLLRAKKYWAKDTVGFG